MRLAIWTFVTITLLVPFRVLAAPEATNADEQTLQSAGLTTDGSALLNFFRMRGRSEGDREQLQTLIGKLRDPSVSVRDRSAAELICWGPAAVPVLRHAVNDMEDADAAQRATKCLVWIEGPASSNLPTAAARLVAVRKPEGAADVLLAYLPFADNRTVLQEVGAALAAVAYPKGKVEPSVVRALSDPVPLRRAVAVAALYRPDQPEQWPAVRKLLQDSQPAVRLKAALTLANAQDSEAIPVLIDLLSELTPEQRKEAEEILRQLAGEWAPGAVTGEDEISRRIRRDAWAAWWRNTDGPALVAAVRKRTLTPGDQAKAEALIKKLGDDTFDVRERDLADLVSMGTLTLPQLRDAIRDTDPEIARRAADCIRLIEKDTGNQLPVAALRLMAVRKPEGGTEALLAFIPHAEDETLATETQRALNALAMRDGKPDPAVVKALEDKLPVRRSAAAEALVRAGVGGEAQAAARKLLQDTDRGVRLRVAIAMASARDKESVPVLIDLLVELPPEQLGLAHEILYLLAGEKAPETPSGTDAEARKKSHDVWTAWWKDHGDKADFAKLDGRQHFLGYTLLVSHGAGRIVELGPDNKMRWQITGLAHPIDAVVLPGNRVLIAEYTGNKVTERDFNGKVLWEKVGLRGNPMNVQRLPDGNTFIATNNGVSEVDRTGKEVYFLSFGVLAANKTRDGHIWCVMNNGRIALFDTTGKELKGFAFNTGGQTGGIDILPNGNLLLPQQNRVVELDTDGKVVWECPAQQPTSASRLPNGNLLIASYATNRVYEMDRAGKVVTEFKENNNQPFRARRR